MKCCISLRPADGQIFAMSRVSDRGGVEWLARGVYACRSSPLQNVYAPLERARTFHVPHIKLWICVCVWVSAAARLETFTGVGQDGAEFRARHSSCVGLFFLRDAVLFLLWWLAHVLDHDTAG